MIHPHPKEWEILRMLCQLGIPTTDTAITINFSGVNWEKLVKLARRHRVLPLLHKGLNQFQSDVPDGIKQRLKEKATFVTRKNLHHLKALIHLAKLFKDIDWLPYKGVVLAQTAYNNLSTRQSSDIDILIRKEDYYQVKEILQNAGFFCSELPPQVEKNLLRYNCEQKFQFFIDGQLQFDLDLHWQIGNQALQLDFILDDFIPYTSPVDLYEQSIQQLTPEALLFITCLHHGGKENWWSLKYLADVAAILTNFQQEFDWDVVIKLAKQKGMLKIVLIGIALTRDLLQIDLPVTIQQLIKQNHLQSYITQHLYSLSKPLPENFEFTLFHKRMRSHFFTRSGIKIKSKLLFYHLLQLLTPSPNDVLKKSTLTTTEQLHILIKKPFRIWGQYLRSSK